VKRKKGSGTLREVTFRGNQEKPVGGSLKDRGGNVTITFKATSKKGEKRKG